MIQVSGEDGDFPDGDWTAPHRTLAGRDEIIAAHGGSFGSLAFMFANFMSSGQIVCAVCCAVFREGASMRAHWGTCTEARDGVMPSEMPLLRAHAVGSDDAAELVVHLTGIEL